MSVALSLMASSKHHVQQLAHRRGLGHLLDRLEVDRGLVPAGKLGEALVLLDLLDHVLDGLVMAGVEPLDGGHHVGLGGDRPFHVHAQEEAQAVDRGGVLRLGHGHRDGLVFLVLRDRHDLVSRGHALAHELGHLGGDRHVVQPDHLHAKLFAECLEHLVFLDEAHPHGDLAQELAAGALLLFENLPEGSSSR